MKIKAAGNIEISVQAGLGWKKGEKNSYIDRRMLQRLIAVYEAQITVVYVTC